MFAPFGLATLISITAWQLIVAGTLRDSMLQFPDIFKQFEDFMVEHEKSYESEEEKLLRFNIFKDNLREIDTMNAESDGTVEYGINQFTDITLDEFKARLTFNSTEYQKIIRDSLPEVPELKTHRTFNGSVSTAHHDDTDSFDWRRHNKWYPKVDDQGDCGSCYAFATAATVDILHSRMKKQILKYSQQQLVDCSKNSGCDGGMFEESYDWAKNPGLVLAKDYPYRCKQGKCNTDIKPVVKVKSYTAITDGDAAVMQALKHCPLAIGMDSNPPELKAYKKGVLKPKACTSELNHAVVLVGFLKVGPKIIWTVRNSWSNTWGERGHFRIMNKYCGIATEVFKFELADAYV